MWLHHRFCPDHLGPVSWFATLGVGLAISLPADGSAQPVEAETEPAFYRLAPALSDPRPPAWMGGNVYYRKGTGLEYRHELKLGDSPIELGLQGPIVRKKKSVGLTVEVRF